MTLSVICKRCKEPIIAETEDDLIAQVEAHARDHGGAHGAHVPSRERILAHLRPRDGELGG
jgi:hypothetical protein